MLKTPKHGWSEITIGSWHDRCSDVSDDVPYKLLEAVDYTNRTSNISSVKFDAEGWEYIIIFDTSEVHIITNDFNYGWKYTTIEICLKNLTKDLIADIRKDLEAWSKWGYGRSEEEIAERKLDLQAWCNVIEKRLS